MSVILGRLYLGVHSPTDVRGGVALGAAIAFLWNRFWPTVDEWVLRGTGLGFASPPVLVVCFLAAFLVLHPQPSPQTPTFLQNALLAGLVSGLVHGSRALGKDTMPLAPGSLNYFLRVLVGYVTVLVGRGALKTVIQKALKIVGIDAKAGAGKSAGPTGQRRVKAWDLFGAAVTKFIVYHFIAWMITKGTWPLFQYLNLVDH